MFSTFWCMVATFTLIGLWAFHVMTMAMLACAAPSNGLDLLAWYALMHGTLLTICLSKLATTRGRLFGYALLVLGLWVSHCFYIHHLDALPKLWIPSELKAYNDKSKSEGKHLRYATDFTLAAFVQDLLMFVATLVFDGRMLCVSWFRVLLGVPIAPWKRETMEKSAKRPRPAKSILKVCQRAPIAINPS